MRLENLLKTTQIKFCKHEQDKGWKLGEREFWRRERQPSGLKTSIEREARYRERALIVN